MPDSSEIHPVAISKLQRPQLEWLNLRVLASSFLEKQDTWVGVMYFTASMVWNADKYQRHRQYITALTGQRVAAVESQFLKARNTATGFLDTAISMKRNKLTWHLMCVS